MTFTKTQVGGNNIDEIVKRLRANDPTLTSIEFKPLESPQDQWNSADYQLGVFTKLIDAMCVNKSVKEFKFGNRVPFNHGAFNKMIGRLLAKNVGLHTLEISSTEVCAAGAQEIAKGLAVNKTLRCFKSVFNKFGDEGAQIIFKALAENTGLQSISIGHDSIGDEGAKSFAEYLRKNKTLRSFSLQNNHIGAIGLESILSALLVNKTVEHADLSMLDMGAPSAGRGANDQPAFERLVEVIEKNKTIINLNLSYPVFDFDNRDHVRIGAALAKNTSIADLNMGCWGLYGAELYQLAKAMDGNTQLTGLYGADFNYTSPNSPTHDEISKALAFSMRNNPNFLALGASGSFSFPEVEALQKANADKAAAFIEKATNPDTPLTAADARYIHKAMYGVYDLARYSEIERLRETTKYQSTLPEYSAMDEEAKKYAYEVLEKADKKIRAIGQTGLKIPAIYRPYSAIDKAPVLNNDKIAAKKVDFSKLEPSALNGSFSSAAKSKKRLSLIHQAVAAGQIDELQAFMDKNGQRLGINEILFKPKDDIPSVAEILASQGTLGKILTAQHWKEDPAGLKKLEAELGHAVISSHLPEGSTLEDILWEIESDGLRQAKSKPRAPIRIGVKSK